MICGTVIERRKKASSEDKSWDGTTDMGLIIGLEAKVVVIRTSGIE